MKNLNIYLLVFLFLLVVLRYINNNNQNKKEGFKTGLSGTMRGYFSNYKRQFRLMSNNYSTIFTNFLRPIKKIL
jgi:hypothetical protein